MVISVIVDKQYKDLPVGMGDWPEAPIRGRQKRLLRCSKVAQHLVIVVKNESG
jgi:hypothetical protein